MSSCPHPPLDADLCEGVNSKLARIAEMAEGPEQQRALATVRVSEAGRQRGGGAAEGRRGSDGYPGNA